MVDELDRTEELPEPESGEENPPEVEGPDTDNEVSGNGESQETEEVNARIVELEQALTAKEDEIAGLKQTGEEMAERLAALSDSLAGAITGYRTMVLQANPEIVEELITGDTIESVNESLERAKALVNRVRQGLETEISLARVPAGAPERTAPDLTDLSPREKIKYAIGGNS